MVRQLVRIHDRSLGVLDRTAEGGEGEREQERRLHPPSFERRAGRRKRRLGPSEQPESSRQSESEASVQTTRNRRRKSECRGEREKGRKANRELLSTKLGRARTTPRRRPERDCGGSGACERGLLPSPRVYALFRHPNLFRFSPSRAHPQRAFQSKVNQQLVDIPLPPYQRLKGRRESWKKWCSASTCSVSR